MWPGGITLCFAAHFFTSLYFVSLAICKFMDLTAFAFGCSEMGWVKKGYRNWNKFLDPTSGFWKHANGRMHQLSLERYNGYCNSKINCTAHKQLNEQAREDKSCKAAENRQVVQITSDWVLFLSKQGLPFCGHDGLHTFCNRGNFLDLIHFLAKYCPQLQKWQRLIQVIRHPGQNDLYNC